jgi:hypothetical protein
MHPVLDHRFVPPCQNYRLFNLYVALGLITHSQYLAQMGGYKPFTQKMKALLIEDYTVNQLQMVFLTDGTPWLRNWIADAFRGAVSILDFYHLLQHLYLFAVAFLSDKAQGGEWVEKQKRLLLKSRVR